MSKTETTTESVEIDREFQSLITPLTDEERSLLEADLIEHGCLDPLIVWQEENVFLDGHNRYELCSKHDIDYQIKYLSFPDREAAKEWMIRHQLGRRNLTPNSLSYYRGKLYNTLKQKITNPTGENQYRVEEENQLVYHFDPQAGTDNQNLNPSSLPTAQKLASQYQVGARTIKRDGEYASAIDTLVRTVDTIKLLPALLSRKIKLSKVDALKLRVYASEYPEIVKQTYSQSKSGKQWLTTVEYKIQKLISLADTSFPYQSGDVVIIRSQRDSEYEIKVLSGCWGIIKEVGSIACSVLVYNGVLSNVRATELEASEQYLDKKKSAKSLMNRLQKIAEFEIADPMVNEILLGIGRRDIFDLPSTQELILTVIESELGIKKSISE